MNIKTFSKDKKLSKLPPHIYNELNNYFSSGFPQEKLFPSIGLKNNWEYFKSNIKIDLKIIEEAFIIAVNEAVEIANYNNYDNLFSINEANYILTLSKINENVLEVNFINNKLQIIPTVDLYCVYKNGISKTHFKKGECILQKLMKLRSKSKQKYIYFPFKNLLECQDIMKDLTAGKIYFSSSGTVGAWDIATMSQRGIMSCMRWDHQNSRCLVGSILDPRCAVIYLSNDKKTPFGRNMLARSVVRLAVKNGEQHIIIENPYLNIGKISQQDEVDFAEYVDFIEAEFASMLKDQIQNIFEKYIRSQNADIKIVKASDIKDPGEFHIPKGSYWNNIPLENQSYVDCKVRYE